MGVKFLAAIILAMALACPAIAQQPAAACPGGVCQLPTSSGGCAAGACGGAAWYPGKAFIEGPLWFPGKYALRWVRARRGW